MVETKEILPRVLATLKEIWVSFLKLFAISPYVFYVWCASGSLFILYWGIRAIRNEKNKKYRRNLYGWLLKSLFIWLLFCGFILIQMIIYA